MNNLHNVGLILSTFMGIFPKKVLPYLDPSVVTYLIQVVIGVAITIGSIAFIYWRKAKQKVTAKLGIGVETKKEVEDEVVNVTSKVPVAEMFGFSNIIRGATQGRAVWYQEYFGYEKVPKDLLDKVVRDIRKRKGEPEAPPTPEFFLEM